MRRVLFVVSLGVVSGCAHLHADALRDSARFQAMSTLSCREVVAGQPNENGVIAAKGCDREVRCAVRYYGPRHGRMECLETEESEQRTLRKLVVDRLSLETSCPTQQVSITEQANWTRGTEHAYRLSACGKPYVCTTAAGRTDCKPALATEGASTSP
jgi:hypothetical protein